MVAYTASKSALAALTVALAEEVVKSGILVNAAWAVACITSIIIGRPLLGYAAAMLDRGYAVAHTLRSTQIGGGACSGPSGAISVPEWNETAS